jgi:hypothetical protein
MRKLLENPLLWRGQGRWPGSARQTILAALVFAVDVGI